MREIKLFMYSTCARINKQDTATATGAAVFRFYCILIEQRTESLHQNGTSIIKQDNLNGGLLVKLLFYESSIRNEALETKAIHSYNRKWKYIKLYFLHVATKTMTPKSFASSQSSQNFHFLLRSEEKKKGRKKRFVL